jgi:hypothetical protein
MTPMDTSFDVHREYKGVITIEQLVGRQIDRINEYGTRRDNEKYNEGVEHLVDLLSPEHEQKALEYQKENGISHDISPVGKLRYRALFRFIKHLLAKGNIVWKTSRYEVGSETPYTKDTEPQTIETTDQKHDDIVKEFEAIDNLDKTTKE